MRLIDAPPATDAATALRSGAALLFVLVVAQLAIVTGNLNPSAFGVKPGEWPPWPGLLTAPLAHGSGVHFLSNLVPLVALFVAAIYLFGRWAWLALGAYWIAGGVLVWFFARPAPHLGASGLVYGFAAQLTIAGFLRGERAPIAIGLLIGIFYGSMLWGLFPLEAGVSFESHLAGAALGLLIAVVQRIAAPPLPPPSLEDDVDDSDDEDDPLDSYFEQLDESDELLEEAAEDDDGARR